MASIFTFEPDPPRVASPWQDVAAGLTSSSDRTPQNGTSNGISGGLPRSDTSGDKAVVMRLHAEPQEGPVEYKLHLLLRPRRKFKASTTANVIAGSRRIKRPASTSVRVSSEPAIDASIPASTSATLTKQTRQLRLEQLTTQLLWRLQQSSPHHTSSATNIILPSLPEALPELQTPQQPAKLLHGLEESQGALYEIGVSDDGTLVGLTEDEMEESLNNLRAMAACLGCKMEVLRREVVGTCEWVDEKELGSLRSGSLCVAEAYVTPYLLQSTPTLSEDPSQLADVYTTTQEDNGHVSRAAEQLRITMTGPTMSGKSTLLGTLTTSTLDNGRGSSRLSMLKHRHEITSGITSSVTQELLGYQDSGNDAQVVNYATENVASWIDVHAAADGSRLVFVSDSAGHPRYRRTTLRGLVGWSPHWTLLCIPADDAEDNISNATAQQAPLTSVPDLDLSGAQLDLCLRLGLPLVVVITKLDLASRNGLKGTLSRILDALKAAGRKPAILPNAPGTISEEDLRMITNETLEKAYNTALPLLNDPTATVPIVLTSALQGSGISNLHALLHELPIPSDPRISQSFASSIFHIEDIYTKPADVEGVIVSGRLRSGQISVGDTVVLGPFSTHTDYEDSEDSDERPRRRSSSHLPSSRSFPGALRDLHLNSWRFQLPGQEWKRVKVISIRNLRLPVASLQSDQVGTLAVVFEEDDKLNMSASVATAFARIRKGMVLAAVQPTSARSITARFSREDLTSLAIGNHVVVYIASVRASAKIVSARVPDETDSQDTSANSISQSFAEEPFNFESESNVTATGDGTNERISIAGAVTAKSLLVTLRFDSFKEIALVGDRVLIMPGGGPGLLGGQERGQKGVAALDGFVGRIVEVDG
jgi:GTPase